MSTGGTVPDLVHFPDIMAGQPVLFEVGLAFSRVRISPEGLTEMGKISQKYKSIETVYRSLLQNRQLAAAVSSLVRSFTL